ncbi:interleukin-21 receptor [Trachinotus anak]|uniref:interleukin-21 receptor n=1 Tax=Trachinotus anak TaxID=443729 RepID=UPI0039F1DC60
MSRPAGVMDWSSTPRLKLTLLSVFLLVSAYIVRLHGNPIAGAHGLRCVNDYLSTINCTLSIVPTENTSDSNSSYWLTFTRKPEQSTFECMLTNTSEDYFCSVKASEPMDDDYDYLETFADLETFIISLCHNQNDGSEICKVLDGEYQPLTTIKPNAPCCLTVSHNSSQHNFTWKSTYEEYSPFTNLVNNFKYQLRYFKRGGKHNGNSGVMSRDINTDRKSYYSDDQIFEPDTEYTARVRTSPNLAFYKGQWSDWSSEVHWKTESSMNDVPTNTFISEMGKVFIPICVMAPLILLLCYAPVKKWRQSAFIPTPAPYFQTLYSDCQGDFKSWVITHENIADMLNAEASLQIDTLTKCADVPEEDCQPQFHHQLMEASAYSNINDPVCDTSLLGVPYAVSTMAPLSAPGNSLKSLTLSSQPGSPAEGDSGCWLCSDTSLERDSPWYCNEYCTLSAFQQTSPVTAEHNGKLSTKSWPQGIIGVDGIGEA